MVKFVKFIAHHSGITFCSRLHNALKKPDQVLKLNNRDVNKPAWVGIAQHEWSANTGSADTVKTLGAVVSIASALPILIQLACGL